MKIYKRNDNAPSKNIILSCALRYALIDHLNWLFWWISFVDYFTYICMKRRIPSWNFKVFQYKRSIEGTLCRNVYYICNELDWIYRLSLVIQLYPSEVPSHLRIWPKKVHFKVLNLQRTRKILSNLNNHIITQKCKSDTIFEFLINYQV